MKEDEEEEKEEEDVFELQSKKKPTQKKAGSNQMQLKQYCLEFTNDVTREQMEAILLFIRREGKVIVEHAVVDDKKVLVFLNKSKFVV